MPGTAWTLGPVGQEPTEELGEDYPRAIPLARGSPAAEERTQYGQGFPPPGRHLNNENAPFKERKKKTPTRRLGRAS